MKNFTPSERNTLLLGLHALEGLTIQELKELKNEHSIKGMFVDPDALVKKLTDQAASTEEAIDDLAEKLRQEYDHWNEHPDVPVSDWKYEVGNGDTRLGYWEYVADKLRNREDDE